MKLAVVFLKVAQICESGYEPAICVLCGGSTYAFLITIYNDLLEGDDETLSITAYEIPSLLLS